MIKNYKYVGLQLADKIYQAGCLGVSYYGIDFDIIKGGVNQVRITGDTIKQLFLHHLKNNFYN